MDLPAPDGTAIAEVTSAYRRATGYDGPIEPSGFGDSAQMMEQLGQLVLSGPKRATAAWPDPDDLDDEPTQVGDHELVLGGRGQPLCIIALTEVRRLPYRQVDPAFAFDEGEGDRTLEHWRAAHDAFFARQAEREQRTFGPDSIVELMRFTIVWPERDPVEPVERDGDLTVRFARPDDREWIGRVTHHVSDEDGWPSDQLPALLARRQLMTAGTLVFRPRPNGAGSTEVVATALLDEAPDVDALLRHTLREQAREHRWAHPRG